MDILSKGWLIREQFTENFLTAFGEIDKDLKAELRETAFNMWMACYDNQEIADAIGFSRPVVSEFVNSIPSVGNGMSADSDDSSENPELTNSESIISANRNRAFPPIACPRIAVRPLRLTSSNAPPIRSVRDTRL